MHSPAAEIQVGDAWAKVRRIFGDCKKVLDVNIFFQTIPVGIA